MPKFKTLSGKEVVSVFTSWGFEIASQRGSHVKLARMAEGAKQTLTIPNHKNIDKGTLAAIVRQAGKYISKEKLDKAFKI